MAEASVEQQQLDYAWKWFAFHAEQRFKMFAFTLIAFGFLTIAYGIVLNSQIYFAALLISLVSLFLSILFVQLDHHNKTLVWRGEDLLGQLETRYTAPGAEADKSGKLTQSGKRSEPLNFQGVVDGEHHTIFPLVAYAFAALFFALTVVALFCLFPKNPTGGYASAWGALLPLLLFAAPLIFAVYEYRNFMASEKMDRDPGLSPRLVEASGSQDAIAAIPEHGDGPSG